MTSTFPILCGYRLHDDCETTGALMIHVARSIDIAAEFKLQMDLKYRTGWFGRYPPRGYDFIWYRTRNYPNK